MPRGKPCGAARSDDRSARRGGRSQASDQGITMPATGEACSGNRARSTPRTNTSRLLRLGEFGTNSDVDATPAGSAKNTPSVTAPTKPNAGCSTPGTAIGADSPKFATGMTASPGSAWNVICHALPRATFASVLRPSSGPGTTVPWTAPIVQRCVRTGTVVTSAPVTTQSTNHTDVGPAAALTFSGSPSTRQLDSMADPLEPMLSPICSSQSLIVAVASERTTVTLLAAMWRLVTSVR